MATLESLCAAMRAAAVSSVWLAVQRSLTSRATIYQVMSDLPVAFRTDDPIYDRVTGYQHIDGLSRYVVSVRGRAYSSLRVEAGSGLWPIGTLGYQLLTGSTTSSTITFTAMWSPRPLDIVDYTRPRTGSRPTSFYSNTQYNTAVSDLQTIIDSLQAAAATAADDLTAFYRSLSTSLGLAFTSDQKSLAARAERLYQLSLSPRTRVIFSRAYKLIRMGRY